MKTKEELNALKEEVEALNKKLAELTEEELVQVIGGEGEEEKKICPQNLEEAFKSVCVTNGQVCPYAQENGDLYVCLLGKGSFNRSRYEIFFY